MYLGCFGLSLFLSFHCVNVNISLLIFVGKISSTPPQQAPKSLFYMSEIQKALKMLTRTRAHTHTCVTCEQS